MNGLEKNLRCSEGDTLVLSDLKALYNDLIGEQATLRVLRDAKRFEKYQSELKRSDPEEFNRLYREYAVSLLESYRKGKYEI